MISFKHKKHMHEHKGNAKIVIYYNVSDIFLGATLLVLVVFFINDYLSHALSPLNMGDVQGYTEDYSSKVKTNPTSKIP